MHNSEYIELLKNSRTHFFICRLELENIFHSLNYYEMDSSFISKKVGVYKHLKKLLPCFDILSKVSGSNSVQSLITLQRMIVDNYAIFFLLTSFSSKEEQLLRYYLYLLDATNSRLKIINNFSSNIKCEIPNETIRNAENAIIADSNSSIELIKLIKENNLYSLVNEEIINKFNWKYKDANKKKQSNNYYKWTELYTIAKIPNHHAQMLQNYYSSFVHGLGISLTIEDDDNLLPFIISTLDFCSILQSMIIKIIMTEFKEETKNVKLKKKTIDFMNDNWNNWK